MSVKPTDQQILDTLPPGCRRMTYVIANYLAMDHREFRALETSFVRRRLMAMEKAGKVVRVPSSYITQICWMAAPATQTTEGAGK